MNRVTLGYDHAQDLFYLAVCEVASGRRLDRNQMDAIWGLADKLDFQSGGHGHRDDVVDAIAESKLPRVKAGPCSKAAGCGRVDNHRGHCWIPARLV